MSTTPKTAPLEKIYPAELKPLLERAAKGDTSVLPDLKNIFDQYPELVIKFGDMAAHAMEALLSLVTGPDLVAREAISREATALQERLMATANSDLERLLISRIVITWIEVYFCDFDLARRLQGTTGVGAATQAAEKRLDRAHARHLASIKALATVQKLLKPSISTFDLLRRPISETAATWPGREKAAKIPVSN